MEKVQLILQLLHPYTFIPTSTVIREMRVKTESVIVATGVFVGNLAGGGILNVLDVMLPTTRRPRACHTLD